MGLFYIIPLYFIIFRVFIPLYFVKNEGAIPLYFIIFLVVYSSLFYQKVVSLHAEVLYLFSDLNKMLELCIYKEQ